MAHVVAKFKCVGVKHTEGGNVYVELQAVSGPGNEDFTQYTPNGKMEIMIAAGAPAQGEFSPGDKFIIGFTKTEA